MSNKIQIIEPEEETINTDPVGVTVATKSSWGASWVLQDNLFAESSEQTTGLKIPVAAISYDYGNIKRHDVSSFNEDSPLEDDELYLRIQLPGETPLTTFVGILQSNTNKIMPPIGSTITTGQQTLTGFGIEQLFDRQPIDTTYIDGGSVDRVYSFNDTYTGGRRLRGNRSTSPTDDVYTFSDDKEIWDHQQMAEYLIDHFAPASLTLKLTGQVAALAKLKTVVSIAGLNLRQALNMVIPQEFGLGWRRVVDDNQTISLEVFTIVDKDLGELPANKNQATINITDGLNMNDCLVKTQQQMKVDEIHVVGAFMISTFTLSYEDGTLENGWTEGMQTAYDSAADDPERSVDKFNAVYQYHRLPTDWNFEVGDGIGGTQNTILPTVNDDGTLDLSVAGKCFQLSKALQRDLPFLERTTYTGGNVTDNSPSGSERDQQRCFAVIQDPDNDAVYVHVEKASSLGADKHSANFGVNRREMGIIVAPKLNHQYALEDFAGNIDKAEAVMDFNTIVATVSIETDTRLKFIHKLDNQGSSENSKIKYIEVPDAQLWYVAPGTVWGLETSGLQHFAGDGELRNDREQLKTIAEFTAAWFARHRQGVKYSESSLSVIASPGTMILTASSAAEVEEIGTVVTRLSHDYRNVFTEIETTYMELSFTAQPRIKPWQKKVGSPMGPGSNPNRAPAPTGPPVVSGPMQIEAAKEKRRLEALEAGNPIIRQASGIIETDPTFVKWDE